MLIDKGSKKQNKTGKTQSKYVGYILLAKYFALRNKALKPKA